jgi:hypothetical protein
MRLGLALAYRSLALAASLVAPTFAGEAFYCGEKLVELGAGEQEVIGKCGVPDFSETWEEEFVQKLNEDFERSTGVNFAEWTYDYGSNRLIRVLLFREGILKDVQSRGYSPSSSADCSRKIVDVGATKFEVLRQCGQPQARRQATEKRLEPIDALHRRRYSITTEYWTYRGRGDALPRTIVFRNRRVIDIEPTNGS